jgi:photosystem II stability/assembly factor-like uncharacterized protein
MVGFAGQILRTHDGKRGWITYDDGSLVSDDGGESWKTVPIGKQYFLSKLLRVDQSLWAIGQSAVRKQAGGVTWTRIGALVPNRYLGLETTPPAGAR